MNLFQWTSSVGNSTNSTGSAVDNDNHNDYVHHHDELGPLLLPGVTKMEATGEQPTWDSDAMHSFHPSATTTTTTAATAAAASTTNNTTSTTANTTTVFSFAIFTLDDKEWIPSEWEKIPSGEGTEKIAQSAFQSQRSQSPSQPYPSFRTEVDPPTSSTRSYQHSVYDISDPPSSSRSSKCDIPAAPVKPPLLQGQPPNRRRRSWRRRLFLILTEPESSIMSAIFYLVVMLGVSFMNIVMILQTMDAFQYTPQDCQTCGGPVLYLFDTTATNNEEDGVDDGVGARAGGAGFVNNHQNQNCICPPTPLPWTQTFLNVAIYGFSLEWVLRVLTFQAQQPAPTFWESFGQWLRFVTSSSTILDALAIFPYYIEQLDTNGLMSLRLLRLFQVFQLVRLGQYNEHFQSFTTVMVQAIPYLQLLGVVLFFGAAFFGSLIFWFEKGEWKYHSETDSYQFLRLNPQGQEEISPFNSVPLSSWWFLVTATTVGYGDMYPTSTAGKCIATIAMLTGVLVVAFPVSVFSDLWSKQLKKRGYEIYVQDDDDEGDDDSHNNKINDTGEGNVASELWRSREPKRNQLSILEQVRSTRRITDNEMESTYNRDNLPQQTNDPSAIGSESMAPILDCPTDALSFPVSKHRDYEDRTECVSSRISGSASMQRSSSRGSLDNAVAVQRLPPPQNKNNNHQQREDGFVLMDRHDLNRIAEHLHTIQECQREIRGILRKYRSTAGGTENR